LRPASTRGAVLLGAALFALLAIVAAASRAHDTPGGAAGIHQPPRGVGNYLFSIFAVLAVTMAIALAWFWFSERDLLAEHHRKRTKRGRNRFILLVVLGLLFAIAVRFNVLSNLPFREDRQQQVTPPAGGAQKNKEKKPPAGDTAEAPEFKWAPVFVATAAGIVLLGFLGIRAARRARGHLLDSYLLEQELESLLEDTLADLYAEKDPRKAIIAAYARMERLFGSYGLPRRPNEAPMEYLERTLGELRASGSALRRLTALFQWAKFSDHDVSLVMRNEAIEALTRVRDELKANRVEEAVRREERARQQAELADKDDTSGRTFGEDPFEAAEEKAKGSIYGRTS
jgi:hypothetical protein